MVKTLTEILGYSNVKRILPSQAYNRILSMDNKELKKYGLILIGGQTISSHENRIYFAHKDWGGITMIDRGKDFFLEYKSFNDKALKEMKSSLVKLLRKVDFL